MTFTLPKDVLAWRDRIREFVDDELIPWEVHAELNAGEIPADDAARHRTIAREMGLSGMDAPKERGGLALSVTAQVAIWEQLGRGLAGESGSGKDPYEIAYGLNVMLEGFWTDFFLHPEDFDRACGRRIRLSYLDAQFPPRALSR
jgi:hypothetical protein